LRPARWLSHPAAATAIAAATLFSRSARADDELSACTTQSARTPDEIVVQLSDNPNDPPGVTIVVGETLCLAGALDRDGKLRPHLAEGDESTLVLVRLSPDGTVSKLHVRTPPDQWFQVRVAAILGPANLVSPYFRTGGSGRADIRADSGARAWLLSDWVFREPHRYSPPPPPPMPSPEPRTMEFGITTLAGVRRSPLGGFDAPLRASGYEPFARMLPSVGGALQLAWKRWRFAIEAEQTWGTARARKGSGRLGASFGVGLFDAGFDFLRWRGLAGFVLAGAGVGSLVIDASAPNWTYLAPTATALGHPDSLIKTAFYAGLQTGFQETIPILQGGILEGSHAFAITLSAQAGYTLQLDRPGEWSDGKSRDVNGPPPVNLSGTWLYFGIGCSLFGASP
jgi:hypothetical protein